MEGSGTQLVAGGSGHSPAVGDDSEDTRSDSAGSAQDTPAPAGAGTDNRRDGRARWSTPAMLLIGVLAAVLYFHRLSSNAMSNTFYAAAVKSGTESWKAFFFGSLDRSSFITVDKPPVFLWVMEISGRIFRVLQPQHAGPDRSGGGGFSCRALPRRTAMDG